MDILRAVMDFVSRYGSVTHPCHNTEIVGQHKHYRAILIVINFITYKLYIFLPPSRFELGSIKLKR